jgi:hypothetical protein
MRTPVNSHTLAMLVIEELEHRVAEDGEFTAYDITRALRRRQPHLDLPHAAVRVLVHHYMGGLVSTGHYQTDVRAFGRTAAILYGPAPSPTQPFISGVPFLGLN